jgi:hypothetical protein
LPGALGRQAHPSLQGFIRGRRSPLRLLALAVGLHYWYHKAMSTSIRDTKKKAKKVGRPVTTGKGTQVGTRWHEPLLGMIDGWAARQDDKPERSEAIRRLVERGLAAEASPAISSKKGKRS